MTVPFPLFDSLCPICQLPHERGRGVIGICKGHSHDEWLAYVQRVGQTHITVSDHTEPAQWHGRPWKIISRPAKDAPKTPPLPEDDDFDDFDDFDDDGGGGGVGIGDLRVSVHLDSDPSIPQGWQCPACFLIYAPHIDTCGCQLREE